MYKSTHKRNVRGMHDAPRCEEFTAAGDPCRSPAVIGKKRCHVHGGKSSAGRTYGRQFGDFSKATLVRDRQTEAEIRSLKKLIRQMQREGAPPDRIKAMQAICRGLLETTQQKQADLVAAYAPSAADREAARERADMLAAASRISEGRPWLEGVQDRAVGAMLGLAVGEAIGMCTDGWPRGSFHELSDMHGGSRFDLKAGEWAGNTASALALMESLTYRKQLDEVDFMDRLLEWRDDGVFSCTATCIGMDEATREALASYEVLRNPRAGDRHPDNLGCGSLVRVAPVAIRYWNNRLELLNAAERQSYTTHGGPAQIDACRAFADILADAIRGSGRKEVLAGRFVPNAALAQSIVEGSWRDRTPETIRSNDNVLNALEAAMWCVGRAETFDEAVLRAMNLGEAAGTITALTGQLAGAIAGASAIRPSWRERLVWSDTIIEQADALFQLSKPSKQDRR
ncbi:MAG TPA: ADP-ribosylglycohydrolase family protein [Croceibacterium sp.]|nr:ADP-ribosylglycohydrolase family protein [Croceibacterium sp.]